MLSRDNKREQQRREAMMRRGNAYILRDQDLTYTRESLATLLKDYLTDPAHQPYWCSKREEWSRPVTGHHHVAYAICRGKPWNHGLTHHCPRFLGHYHPMSTLLHECVTALGYLVAKDVVSQVDQSDLPPVQIQRLKDEVRARTQPGIRQVLASALPTDQEWVVLAPAATPDVRAFLAAIPATYSRDQVIALVKQRIKRDAPLGLVEASHHITYAILRNKPWHHGLSRPSPHVFNTHHRRCVMGKMQAACLRYLHDTLYDDLIAKADVAQFASPERVLDVQQGLYRKLKATMRLSAFVSDAIPHCVPPMLHRDAYFSPGES